MQTALEEAIADSFVDSFRLIMLIAAALALTSALIGWLMIEGNVAKAAFSADQIKTSPKDSI